MMLLDVLERAAGVEDLHRLRDRRPAGTDFPSHVEDLRRVVPVYETLPGWQQEISAVRGRGRCPPTPEDISIASAELLGRPVEMVSVGPDRRQTIFRAHRDAHVHEPPSQPRIERLARRVPRRNCRATSPSSWTATAAGPVSAGCRGSRGIARG